MKDSSIDPVARRRSLIAMVISMVALGMVIFDSPERLSGLNSAFLMFGMSSLAVMPMLLACVVILAILLRLPRVFARGSAHRKADRIE
ncbi:MAG: hypothetical protein MUF31_10850 [Akkermansiaceae bacterium]|jgi:hypothetical protein|nr:hypothetical protein [Akkermansiaceae bacterium]